MKKIMTLFIVIITCLLTSCTTEDLINGKVYNLGKEYFTNVSYYKSLGIENNTKVYKLNFKLTPLVDMTSISIQATPFNNTSSISNQVELSTTGNIKSDIVYELTIKLDENYYNSYSYFFYQVTGTSSKDVSNVDLNIYTVTFNDPSGFYSVKLRSGKTVNKPTSPTKDNQTFLGWYTDSKFTNIYDFTSPVKSNITLYPKFEVDYKTLTNLITTDYIKSVVTVYTKSYNKFLGSITSYTVSSGSGVIFKEDSGNYYLFTNNHVVIKDPDYDHVMYQAIDYKGNTYICNGITSSPEYEVCILYFTKTINLKVIEFANENPKANDVVVALGQPKSQTNAITYGDVKTYVKISISDATLEESNVTFPVISHNAFIDKGSSGGPLLNSELKLVGLNYASSSDSTPSNPSSYAIPIVKINEFLKLYYK